jgi:hypothetical protein
MARIRDEEEWARRCVRLALGRVHVSHHDDGSSPGMHDIEIVHPDGRRGAVEVTAAADRESIELWNLINGGGRWVEPNLVGGWVVSLSPQARAKPLRAELPALLRTLEHAGVHQVRPEMWGDVPFHEATRSLGISHLSQGETAYPGSIYVTIESEESGGVVPQTGDVLAE